MKAEKPQNGSGKIFLFRPTQANQAIIDSLLETGQYKTRSEVIRHAIYEFGKKNGIIENTIQFKEKTKGEKK